MSRARVVCSQGIVSELLRLSPPLVQLAGLHFQRPRYLRHGVPPACCSPLPV